MAQDIQLQDQYYLTRADYEDLQTEGKLIVGGQYYITDEDYLLMNNYVAQEKVIANPTAVASLNSGQVRNIFISTADPTSADGNNGDIWLKYEV